MVPFAKLLNTMLADKQIMVPPFPYMEISSYWLSLSLGGGGGGGGVLICHFCFLKSVQVKIENSVENSGLSLLIQYLDIREVLPIT